MTPYDYPDYTGVDDGFLSFLRIVVVVLLVAIVVVAIMAATSSSKNTIGEKASTFEERIQEEYIGCVSKATTNRDPDLLTRCKEILEVIQ